MNRARPARAGFSLIEMLCVMVLILVLGAVLAMLFKETLEVEKIQTSGFDRLLQTKMLADQFRSDVARAESVLPEWQDRKADAETLILRMKDKRHIVYAWKEGKLTRAAHVDGEKDEQPLPVGRNVEVEFVQPGKEAVARLRLHLVRDEQRVAGQSLEMAAAVGGDLR
jgi:prepilin-type N-terminal cleavage/methylation domain-containing protein